MPTLLLLALFGAMTTEELADKCRDAICHKRLALLDYKRSKVQQEFSELKKYREDILRARRMNKASRPTPIRKRPKGGTDIVDITKEMRAAEAALRALEKDYKPQKELIDSVRTKQKPMPKEWLAKMPDLAQGGFDFGTVDKCRVLQILGPDEFIGTQWHEGSMAKQTYLFRGWPTKDINENEVATIPTLGHFADQYTYETVSGARKTVRVIKIIGDDELLEVYKKLTELEGPRARHESPLTSGQLQAADRP